MSSQSDNLYTFQSVRGRTTCPEGTFADAHNHLWIAPHPQASDDLPVLNQEDLIGLELKYFHAAGGGVILDCQPGGCGRDARKLRCLSEFSQVEIICCTGFHLQKYYPPSHPSWNHSADQLTQIFSSEIQNCVLESSTENALIKAGFIKAAINQTIQQTRRELLEAAANSAVSTGVPLMIHTEKGSDAENILRFFVDHGVAPQKLILCHIDKRPDFFLHQELAAEGVLLEYDTFFRPQYDPENNLWPLLKKMLEQGWGQNISLATDMAESRFWRAYDGEPGLESLFTIIKPRLKEMQIPEKQIKRLLGENILSRINLAETKK